MPAPSTVRRHAADLREAKQDPPIPLDYLQVHRSRYYGRRFYYPDHQRVHRTAAGVVISADWPEHPDPAQEKKPAAVRFSGYTDKRDGRVRWFAHFERCGKAWLRFIVEFERSEWESVFARSQEWLRNEEALEWDANFRPRSPIEGKRVFGVSHDVHVGVDDPTRWMEHYEKARG